MHKTVCPSLKSELIEPFPDLHTNHLLRRIYVYHVREPANHKTVDGCWFTFGNGELHPCIMPNRPNITLHCGVEKAPQCVERAKPEFIPCNIE